MIGDIVSFANAFGTLMATAGIFIATVLLWMATEKMSRNVIRPWMFVRASNEEERRETFGSGRELQKCVRKHLDPSVFIQTQGIHVENAGLGPATNGKLCVVKENGEKELVDRFIRIYQGHCYLYPSPDRPNFRVPPEAEKIRVHLIYFDMSNHRYEWEDDVFFRGERVEAP